MSWMTFVCSDDSHFIRGHVERHCPQISFNQTRLVPNFADGNGLVQVCVNSLDYIMNRARQQRN